jgi:hypothetical protein
MDKEKFEYITAWILKAEHDLDSAFIILSSNSYED